MRTQSSALSTCLLLNWTDLDQIGLDWSGLTWIECILPPTAHATYALMP